MTRRISLVGTTVEIQRTPRLVSTVAWVALQPTDGLLLMLTEFTDSHG